MTKFVKCLCSITIGLIGGYGLEKILKNKEKISLKTPYGQPSDKIMIGLVEKKKIAILLRHGQKHQIPPHRIPHQANIYSLAKLGVRNIICLCAVGILNKKIKPGAFILPNDFMDTTGQPMIFYQQFSGKLKHTDMTEPYSRFLREKIKKAASRLGLALYPKGVYIYTPGPRFETAAENRVYQSWGEDVVGMTNVPEIILANELGLNIATIAIGTNYGTGISSTPLTTQEVEQMMKKKEKALQELIQETIKLIK